MELFSRRYFCFFAFLFLLASFLSIFLSGTFKLIFALLALALVIALLVVMVLNKKHRFCLAVVMTSFIFICIAIFNSFFFITIPREKAENYMDSSRTVKMKVLSKETIYENGSEYIVRITHIDGDEINIKAYFCTEGATEFSHGDKLIAQCNISKVYKNSGVERDVLLYMIAEQETPMLLDREEKINYFSLDGIGLICGNIRDAFSNYIDSLFGKQDGALVKGFLVNDKSGLPFSVYSDFKRSGTLHLLAVSGLHIALLMGALELLLKKLLVNKKIRCLIVSLCAIFFLILANFAASAVRSVLMLFSVYINYLFSEDDDTITALFVSVFLITLFSPNSVYDLGMWMSFLATLGLVSVYPLYDKYIPRVKVKRKLLALFLKALRAIGSAVTLTLVANFFLLPIMYYFFGSISLSSIPANLVLSPLSSIYLPLCAIAALIGFIPLLNTGLVLAVRILGKVILFFGDFFSDFKGGVLSLRYPFVPLLVVLFAVALAVLLVVKLKQKLWVFAPVLVFVVAFSISLGVYSATYKQSVKYVSHKNNEILLFEDGRSLSICDVSNGSVAVMEELYGAIPEYATEVDSFILTHAHKSHVYALERFIVSYPIRTLYLPISNDKEELVSITAIYLIAREYDTNVVFYESGREIGLFDEISLQPYFENSGGHSSVYLEVSNEESLLVYSDLSECDAAIEKGAESSYFLLGTHGSASTENEPITTVTNSTNLIFATKERSAVSRVKYSFEAYVPPIKNQKIKFVLPLE